jgi:flagellar hook-basal body complex protein FliE
MTPFVVPLEALGGAAAVAPALLPASALPAQPAASFGQWFTREVESVNTQMVTAERSVQQLASGGSANLHDTMLQLEQARLSFQLAIQVRSKVMEAYQDVMRMQV